MLHVMEIEFMYSHPIPNIGQAIIRFFNNILKTNVTFDFNSHHSSTTVCRRPWKTGTKIQALRCVLETLEKSVKYVQS